MKRAIAALLMTVAVLASGISIAAHHSFAAQYDREKPITLKGTLTRMEWANPHVYFHIDVAETGGAPVNWAIEGGAPNTLYRAGWRKDSAKVGEDVTVDGFLARDGSKLVNMQTAVLADGRKLFVGTANLLPEGPLMRAVATARCASPLRSAFVLMVAAPAARTGLAAAGPERVLD